jgi:hypothetical protein
MKKTHNQFAEVKVHSFDGNIEEADKFVEVDGKKFVDDGSGKAKLGDDGQPVPFVEKKADEFKIDNVSEADLEALAKVNPHVARMLADKTKAEQDLKDKEVAESQRKQKELEEKGEWQKLAEERQKEIDILKGDVSKKDEMLGKYKGSVEAILKDVIATIPKERLSLIPADFSPRQKLEYITKNAKLLGAKVAINQTGEGVDKNDGSPVVTDEEKLINEMEELRKKSPRTASEDKLYFEKATQLKALRAKKDQQ